MRDRSMALVVRNNKILSVQTHRSGRYINELAGGGIEPGETSEEAAQNTFILLMYQANNGK